MNPGGIRADLDQGEITWGEVFTAFPFGYSLVTMNMTGGQIKSVLEQQWIGSEPRILQISGLLILGIQMHPLDKESLN